MRCGWATTTIGGVIDWAKAVLASKLAAKPMRIERCITLLTNYATAPSTEPNRHRLVNHAARRGTLPKARGRFVVSAFILRKTPAIVVNAVLRHAALFREPRYVAQPSVNVARDIVVPGATGCVVQRKVFRVEAMMADRRPLAAAYAEHRRETAPPRPKTKTADHTPPRDVSDRDHLKAELLLIRDAIARNRRDLGKMIGSGDERHMTRATDELGAAIDGMETATQKILHSVEVIDDNAKALTASIKDEYKRGLAQDIQEHVLRIYESCNFQDIAGQRIGKVMATLAAVEEQVAEIMARYDGLVPEKTVARPSYERGLLNGPKLDKDVGHASQHDIDKMFR
jgi:chemotaxis protein CheZ